MAFCDVYFPLSPKRLLCVILPWCLDPSVDFHCTCMAAFNYRSGNVKLEWNLGSNYTIRVVKRKDVGTLLVL